LFLELLRIVVGGGHLSADQVREAMEKMLSGDFQESEAAALLVALRMRGETAEELAAAAGVLRSHMIRFESPRQDLLDTCGTGGSGKATFNISTATAFAAAGAGVPVVKHGNRAISGSTGSADVLSALGVTIQESLTWVQTCLERAGLAFCFAPHFHPLMKRLAPLRSRLGISTLFNYIGPLANPAGAGYQLLGVPRAELLDPVAGALAKLGTRHALVVHGQDGMDEVSLAAPTLIREVRGNKVSAWELQPQEFDLEPCLLSEIRVSGPSKSAATIEAILNGQESPASRIVVANAAVALLAAERVGTVAEGVERANEAIDSGAARQVLSRLQACSKAAE
jgi:anthranilate phosphoribosyltransferase